MIQLSKKDTYYIIYKAKQRQAFKKNYSFTSRHKGKCLGCMKDLYISFRQFNIKAIFCWDCRGKVDERNIVQVQYMRYIKEQQLKLVEQYIG